MQIWVGECSVTILHVCSHPSGPRYLATADTTRQGDLSREPATPTHDAYLRRKSQSTTVYHTETKPLSGHYKVPGQGPHITTEYSVNIRIRTPRARVSLHIQKPKPQASIQNKIEKFYILFDVYNTTNKRWCGQGSWDGNVTAATKKNITLPWQCGFSGGEKRGIPKATY